MKSRIIIIFYLLIYTLSGKAQSISFLHLTTDDGLPNNSISSIYQDEREFMWFGTRNGIGVYNGKKIKISYYRLMRNLTPIPNDIGISNFDTICQCDIL